MGAGEVVDQRLYLGIGELPELARAFGRDGSEDLLGRLGERGGELEQYLTPVRLSADSPQVPGPLVAGR